jgi:phosphatidylcholine synthase
MEGTAVLPLRLSDLIAASVHVFTALGAVCGLMAALAAFDGAWERMFVWLGVALVIDAIDGTFARMVRVEERLPRFSGERLDLVIDYITYVFVPALALLRGGFLTGTGGLIVAALILLSSLYHFSDLASKADDASFVGFPTLWNVVAFYAFALAPPAWVIYPLLLALVLLTFIPMHWVHPVRVARLRWVTLAMTAAWGVAAVAAIWIGFPAPLWLQLVLVVTALYFTAMTLELTFRLFTR